MRRVKIKDIIARSLATHRTQTVGLVVPDVSNPFFAGVARVPSSAATTSRWLRWSPRR